VAKPADELAAAGPRPRVLVIDDEPPVHKFLRAGLEAQGYAVEGATNGGEGITHASMHPPDVVLLDLGLPDVDGFEVVRRLREWSATPIIILSARGQDGDKVRALDAGADDYVTKPFSMPELLARMRVALRNRARVDGAGDASFEAGPLRIDLGKRRVTVEGREVRLTPLEYRLLTTLARHPGRVLTHDMLLREVWGPGHVQQHHYLRVYMAQLRHKIEKDPARPRLLLTEPGVGYRMAETA
jgi:two-component system, OmpR family, KDP operon response regulator KdpE